VFFVADEQDIKNGKVTDIYFKRTEKILKAKKIDVSVKAEVFLKRFPLGYNWGVLAGIEETVRCMPEGTVFTDYEPVMVIEGKYLNFGIYETSILGFLCHSSGIATKAARCKLAAGDRSVFNFGARRVHPVIAPMVERCAFIGGADGVSTIAGAEAIGLEPVGTIPHALILIMGDTVKATKAFNEIIKPGVSRISLIDTFNDEKFEAIKVCEALGKSLFGVRLDTPSSRRGDFKKILEEVRWELDIRGYKDIKLVVSGGLDENDIIELNCIADAYGIGTSISGARTIDFSMDIVEIEGEKIAKRGKMSGAKKVIRCENCFTDKVVLDGAEASDYRCEFCGGGCKDLFVDAIKNGELAYEFLPASKIREKVLNQFKFLEL
jgi:nicotinate phosphoribosyltransferase